MAAPQETKSYLSLVPRGFEGVFIESAECEIRSQGWFVSIEEIGSEIRETFLPDLQTAIKQQHENDRKKQRKECTEGSCRGTVGTFSMAANKHCSLGYAEGRPVWSQAGLLQGTVWMEIQTNACIRFVSRMRCMGPLLALVDVISSKNGGEGQSLDEAVVTLSDAISRQYSSKFQSALTLWRSFEKECWPSGIDSNASLKYRLSCMRQASKKYCYTREEFVCSRLMDPLLPDTDAWSVDLKCYDLEVVLFQRPRALVVALNLRPYQRLGVRDFGSGTIPPDISTPYVAAPENGMVRLRPATAQLLLRVANIKPGDLILDPCAGIGTIPVEATLNGAVAIGGDLVMTDPTLKSLALSYTRKAACTARQAELLAWDATNVPLRSQCVDVIVSDLPFGQLCMNKNTLGGFMPLLLAELSRLLVPDTGRAILLCGSYPPVLELLKQMTDQQAGETMTTWKLPCASCFPVNIGGHVAWVIKVYRGRRPYAPIYNQREKVKNLTRKRERIANLNKNNKAGKKRAQA